MQKFLFVTLALVSIVLAYLGTAYASPKPALTISAGVSTSTGPGSGGPDVLEISIASKNKISANEITIVLAENNPTTVTALYNGKQYNTTFEGFVGYRIPRFIDWDWECSDGQYGLVGTAFNGSEATIIVPCAIPKKGVFTMSIQMEAIP
jgi:hypothetical protein